MKTSQNKISLDYYLNVPRDLVTEKDLQKAAFKVIDLKGNETKINLYIESETHYHFYREVFDYYHFGKPENTFRYACVNWPEVSLRDYQLNALRAITGNFEFNDLSFILKSPCGSGKTRISIATISAMKTKTFILCPSKQLMYQWRENIKELLDYDAGLFYANSKKLDKDIVIGLTQSVMKSDLNFDKFDLLIGDECHNNAADSWSKALTKFKGFRLLVSATPDRPDGMSEVIYAHAGNVKYEITNKELEDLGYILKPKVIFVRYDNEVKEKMSYYTKRVDTTKILRELSLNDDRNQFLQNLLDKQISKGHKTLSISKRKYILNELKEKANYDAGLVVSKSDLNKELAKDHLLGIESLAKQGLDKPELSLVLLTTPVQNKQMYEQCKGRVSRYCEGKKDPVVVDVVDSKNSLYQLAKGKRCPETYLERAFLRRLEFVRSMCLQAYVHENGKTLKIF